ncbi:hypothetical protein [Alicyclobacillus suci]|uniref:hypothetical protein n=1 Tax=Alicyclobacillus suci TaxID=2816080 RepID=UPI001A8F2AF3|nr:hypothetical protein [Alicyclobacillus suci]
MEYLPTKNAMGNAMINPMMMSCVGISATLLRCAAMGLVTLMGVFFSEPILVSTDIYVQAATSMPKSL